MEIIKHTVVKEAGILTYSEISPIYKNQVKFVLDDKGYCGDDIIFTSPLEVKWKYMEISILDESAFVKKIEIEYDFGMKHDFFPEKMLIESPDFWKFRNIDLTSPIIEITKQLVEEQLIFALHRNPCELQIVHWALRGWLKDRAVLPWHNELRKI